MQQRFQGGHLWLRKGKRTKAWYLRYRDAQGKHALAVLGEISDLPTMSAARAKAAEFLAPVNGGRQQVGPVEVRELVERYRREEMPARPSTRAAYASLLARWIEPKWGSVQLSALKAADVEAWLRTTTRAPKTDAKGNPLPPEPLSPKTRANLRQLMHVLFECARRWEMLAGENPIELVRQSAKRTKKLARLSVQQYRRLIGALLEPHRTMALIAGCMGLRIGEVVGLKWADVGWYDQTIWVQRDIYQGREDDLKSRNSDRVLPCPAVVIESLRTWRANTPYQADSAYIFAQANGRPIWADTAREKILQPVAASLGIGKIGWHAFRHLFASVLAVVGAEPVVAKELMGHADYRTTESYMAAFDDRKRAAADAVAEMLRVQ